jgi:hypothetical protein
MGLIAVVFAAVVKAGWRTVVTVGNNDGVFNNNGANLFSGAMR